MKTSIKTSLISLFSLIATGIALFQTYHFFSVRHGAAKLVSFCTFGSFDCEVIETSSYAEIFSGIPLASFAAGWFLTLFIISFFLRDKNKAKETLQVVFAMSIIGTLISLFYLYIMAFQIQKYCLLCLCIDAISIIILLLTISLKPKLSFSSINRKSVISFATVFASCFAVTIAVPKILEPKGFSQNITKKLIFEVINTPSVFLETGENTLTTGGNSNAPITVVKYSDFQCPYCKRAAQMIHPVLKKFPNQVRFVFKNFPLDSQCNKKVNSNMHPYACNAAKAVYCANKQNKFEAFYKSLFDHQESISDEKIDELAQNLNLNLDQFKTCLKSSESSLSITKDIEEGLRAGVKSTPTFFVNGKKIRGLLPTVVWFELIEEILAQKP